MVVNNLSDYQQSRTGNKDWAVPIAASCIFRSCCLRKVCRCLKCKFVLCVDKIHFLGYHTKLQVYIVL